MKNRRAFIVLPAVLAITVAFPLIARAQEAVPDAVVQFGPLHPQPLIPLNHRLDPDEVTINKGGTVRFVMNGGGHRVLIYPVSKKTVRADIEEDLCQGPGAPACTGSTATSTLQYLITDGKGDLIIDTGTNVQQPFINYQPGLMLSAGGPLVLTGTSTTNPLGHQVQYRFEKTGRYLVICGTRGHSLNDWMFGFVNVVGSEEE